MDLNDILATFSPEVRESNSMKGLTALFQTLFEQLQATQEALTKSQEKIKKLEDELIKLRNTPKRPKFHPNGMQPRNRHQEKKNPFDPLTPAMGASLIEKEITEVTVKEMQHPPCSRFKGYHTFSVRDIGLVAKEITYKLEVWQTPNGEMLTADLPEELKGNILVRVLGPS